MSKIDIRKEKNEEKCLDSAIELSKREKAKTRNILKKMSGITIQRPKNNNPDIVRFIQDETDVSQKTIIGIEHFLVDQAFIIKEGKPNSLLAEYQGHIQRTAARGRSELQQDGSISDEIMDKLFKDQFGLAASLNTTGFTELILTFKRNLEKHLGKVDMYRSNLESLAENTEIKLALLIEIRSFFNNVFLNLGRNVYQKTDGLFPICQEMVDILNQVDSSKIDYIVLYIQNAVDPNIAKVIAIETKDPTAEFRKQGIPIYEYCGDFLEIEYILQDSKPNEDNKVRYIAQPKPSDNYMRLLIPGIQKAYRIRKEGRPFIATRAIQEMLYAFGNEISFYKDPAGELLIKTKRTQEEVLSKFDEFTEKYPNDLKHKNTYLAPGI